MSRTFRITLVMGLVLSLAMLGGPANASPLQSVTASAYGAQTTGLLALGPLVPVSASFPPAADNQRSDLLRIPADPLLFSGTATTRAVTTTDASLASSIPAARMTVVGGGAVPGGYNARAYARTEGLAVGTQNVVTADPNDLIEPALISVGAVEAEALVACVNGRPVIVSGSRLAGPLKVAGLDLEAPVDNTLNAVTDALQLPGILEVKRNLVTPLPNGVEVIALQIRVLGTGLVVNVSEARVSGSACAETPECSDGIDNDGDGRIDIADPECHTDGNANNPASYNPNDDSEAGLLPRTGGTGPGLGVALLALGLLTLLGAQKLRKSELG